MVAAMCGRYSLATGVDVLKGLFGIGGEAPALAPRWNVAPTQPVAVVVVTNERDRTLRTMRWGLVPSWAKDPSIGNRMINARAETLAEKPSFRDALRRRRCIVVADGFYEWKKEGTRKRPLWIRPRGGGVLAFAGLWDTWRSPDGEVLDTCTIVTTRANGTMAPFHERMPVILPPAAWDRWLDPAPADPASFADLLGPAPDDLLEVREVSTRVNSPANEGPDLLDGPTGS
jgi:putative SOS response-associated peptidase YedK